VISDESQRAQGRALLPAILKVGGFFGFPNQRKHDSR
jgi:hypothetical protein